MRSLWGCQWRGTKRREPGQFSNCEYFTTHNYGLVGEKMDRSGTGSVHACMCVFEAVLRTLPNIMCVWLLHRNHFWPLSPPQSLLHPSLSFPSLRVQNRTKRTVMQRECGAQRSGSNSHHNYIQLLPHCLFHPPLSSLFSLKHPRSVFLLFA